ncbi:SDR family NAD(P)-dependent oxidoreductase [Oricola thermophila]|uniref:SDR family NAD(P)-dependent oxidoreductase n=1 Tax=Oricola thermophila TaxID=2742145 RepID=A0A6N1VB42_9HYPH|nr:SDR family NAD(P)-dependent oxidoreductase [Oricola thermophila]QKV17888.1 SDR family NAD(P)-dependent oxidoreductase [Oricola thermophila]
MKLEGAGAIVTGGASGLGRAVVELFAKAGAKVVVFDLNAEAAAKAAQEAGGVAVAGDVANEEDADRAVDAAIESFGNLRILVNCAGVGTPGRIVNRDGNPQPLADFEKVIRVNLIGTFNMLRVASARMAAQEPLEDNERGVIVNTASVAAFDGQIGQAAYAASKGGIVSLGLPAARELARSGIRVNTIAPGIFLTPLLQSLSEEVQQSLAAAIPFPSRLGKPSEFAELVRFMVENSYMNGEVVRLDGAIRMAPK